MRVELIDDRIQGWPRFALGARTEQGIDNPVAVLQKVLEPGSVMTVEELDRQSAALDDLQIRGGVAGDFFALGPDQDAHVVAAQVEMPRDDKTVATVVALAATYDDRPGNRQSLDEVGHAAAGVLHQHDAGHAKLLRGAAVEFADQFP